MRTTLKTLPIVIPAAAIIVASFGGIEWLRLAGMWSLAAAVAVLVLRARVVSPATVTGKQVGLCLGIAVCVFVAAFLPHSSLAPLTVPMLVGALAGLMYLIGWMLFRLIRLAQDA